MTTDPIDHRPDAVALLGGGPMALAIGRALRTAGVDVVAWNRTASRLDPLREAGARVVGGAAEAIAAHPVVIASLVDHDALDAVLRDAGDAVAGRTVIGLCSDVPARSRTTGGLVASLGGRYLDGSVLTPTETIGTPDGSVLLAGPQELFGAHEDLLRLLGTPTWAGSDLGRAAAIDVASLDLFWTSIAGYLHALALAGAEGVRPVELLPFARGMASILPPILAELADRVERDDHAEPSSSVDSIATSVGHLIAASRAHRVGDEALTAFATVLQDVRASGGGADAVTRVVARLRSRAA